MVPVVPDPHQQDTSLPVQDPDLLTDAELDAAYLAVERVDEDERRRTNAAWTARLIYFCFAVLYVALGLRVLLKLIAANSASGFTRFIYGLTAPFVAPFNNIVNQPTASNGATLDLSALIAILVYLLLNWLGVKLFLLIRDRPSQHSV